MKKFYLLPLAALALTASIEAAAETWPRKVLLEQFTTILCQNCPAGDKTLEVATKGRNDIVWVAHHVGFGTDELTVDDSKELLQYGISGAPMALISREPFYDQQSGTSELPVGIGYTNATAGGAIISSNFDQVAGVEANVNIGIDMLYNPVTRRIRATVNLERNEDLPADALLTVQVVENGVYAERGQAGSNTHGHNHVYRQSLTNIMGDEIVWTDNKSTTDYELVLPEAWNTERVYVIAFVNQPLTRSNVMANLVHNAETSGYFYDPNAGIDGIDADIQSTVSLVGGTAMINGSADGVSVFTVDGRRIVNSNLNPGLYIVSGAGKSGKLLVK